MERTWSARGVHRCPAAATTRSEPARTGCTTTAASPSTNCITVCASVRQDRARFCEGRYLRGDPRWNCCLVGANWSVDAGGCRRRERHEKLFVVAGEVGAPALVSDVQVARHLAPRWERDAEQRSPLVPILQNSGRHRDPQPIPPSNGPALRNRRAPNEATSGGAPIRGVPTPGGSSRNRNGSPRTDHPSPAHPASDNSRAASTTTGSSFGQVHVGGPVPARPEQVPQPALPGQHLACALEQLHHPPIEPTATVVSTLAGGTFRRRRGLERAHPSRPTISMRGRLALLADDLVLPTPDTARVSYLNSGDDELR